MTILVFAVGGCEKISPYVNKVENPSKGFPKGIIAMAIMVLVCATLMQQTDPTGHSRNWERKPEGRGFCAGQSRNIIESKVSLSVKSLIIWRGSGPFNGTAPPFLML